MDEKSQEQLEDELRHFMHQKDMIDSKFIMLDANLEKYQ